MENPIIVPFDLNTARKDNISKNKRQYENSI